jgi:hypothetical protein
MNHSLLNCLIVKQRQDDAIRATVEQASLDTRRASFTRRRIPRLLRRTANAVRAPEHDPDCPRVP